MYIIVGLIVNVLCPVAYFWPQGVSPPQTRRQRLPNFADTSDEEAASLLDHVSIVEISWPKWRSGGGQAAIQGFAVLSGGK